MNGRQIAKAIRTKQTRVRVFLPMDHERHAEFGGKKGLLGKLSGDCISGASTCLVSFARKPGTSYVVDRRNVKAASLKRKRKAGVPK